MMEKAIPRRFDNTAIMQRIRTFLSPPYFKRSSRRQFQQLPVQQPTVIPMDYEKLSLVQAVKKWKRVSWITLAVAMNILLWGFDTGIVGNLSSMPAFQYVEHRAYPSAYTLETDSTTGKNSGNPPP